MADKIVSMDLWQANKNAGENYPLCYISKSRQKGYCTLVMHYSSDRADAYELDFRFGILQHLPQIPQMHAHEYAPIDHLTALGLLKEVLDNKLTKNEKLPAKEAALYDSVTNRLLHQNDLKRYQLPLYSHAWQDYLQMLEEIIIFQDHGLLYELAGEKICPKDTNKHIFLHQIGSLQDDFRIITDSVKISEPVDALNELNEQVLAGTASFEIYTKEEAHCRVVMYYELIMGAQGYLLNRLQNMESCKLNTPEEYRGQYHLARYQLPDGRWLIEPLLGDENFLLCGEKKYSQIYDFLLAKYNAPSRIVLSRREIWLCADSVEKLRKLTAYLTATHLPELENMCLEKAELTAVELMLRLLQNDC